MARRKHGQKRRDPSAVEIDGQAELDDMAVAASFAVSVYTAPPPTCDSNEIDLSEEESDSDDNDKTEEEEKKEQADEESDSDESDIDLAKERAVIEKIQAKETESKVAPKTEHELDPYQTPLTELEKKFQLSLTVEEHQLPSKANSDNINLCLAGHVKSHLVQDRTIIVESAPRDHGSLGTLEEGSLLVFRMEDQEHQPALLIPLGRVFEVFGPVRRPLYTVRLPSRPKKQTAAPKKSNGKTKDSKGNKEAKTGTQVEAVNKEPESSAAVPDETQKPVKETASPRAEPDSMEDTPTDIPPEETVTSDVGKEPESNAVLAEEQKPMDKATASQANTQSAGTIDEGVVMEETPTDIPPEILPEENSTSNVAKEPAVPTEEQKPVDETTSSQANAQSAGTMDVDVNAKTGEMNSLEPVTATATPAENSMETSGEETRAKPCNNDKSNNDTKDSTKDSKGDEQASASVDADPWSQNGKYTKFLSDRSELQIFYLQDEAKIIDSQSMIRMSARGCDASNVYDEEVVNVNEMYFSDDEEERQLKGKRRNRKNETDTRGRPNRQQGGNRGGRGGGWHNQSTPVPAGFHPHQPHPQPQMHSQVYHNPHHQQSHPGAQWGAYGRGVPPPPPPPRNSMPHHGHHPGYQAHQPYGQPGQPYMQPPAAYGHYPGVYPPQQPMPYNSNSAPGQPPPPPPPPPPPAPQQAQNPPKQQQSDTVYYSY